MNKGKWLCGSQAGRSWSRAQAEDGGVETTLLHQWLPGGRGRGEGGGGGGGGGGRGGDGEGEGGRGGRRGEERGGCV